MIDVRLAPFGMVVGGKAKADEARITEATKLERRHRVAAETEEAERAALETIRHLLVAAAKLDQIVPIARGLENFKLLLGRFAGERIASGVVQRKQLSLAGIRNRHRRDKTCPRFARVHPARQKRIAGNEHVAAEAFAVEKHAA